MSEKEELNQGHPATGSSDKLSTRTSGISAAGNTSSASHLRRASTNPHQLALHQAQSTKQKEKKELDSAPNSRILLESIREGEGGPSEPQPEVRRIYLNREYPQQERKPRFYGNSISTSKYNVLSFLPIFLFEMFSRVAYLYFLAQAALSFWGEISPFSPIGATLALLFVLLVSGVKAIAEDVKRHSQDNVTNNTPAVIVDPRKGEKKHCKWSEIKVGDIVMVKDDELFPADILCLETGLKDKVCFIRTTNLDGESNLKIRKPVDVKSIVAGKRDSAEDLTEVEDPSSSSSKDSKKFTLHEPLTLECEVPNGNLHKFRGRLDVGPVGSEIHIPITMSEMLLRGTLLKNSDYVYGLVVYTGRETRIQMNAARVPLKVGSFDRFLNIQIGILISVQAVLCVLLACASYWWREDEGKNRYYLALDQYVRGNYQDGFTYVALNFITFWILTSYMVPISLFVTMEIVKFWQAFMFINNDQNMINPDDPSEHAQARNSNLNEDLGKVEYVFSDKTGTLTSNDMQLRKVNIKGVTYGNSNFLVENTSELNHGMDSLTDFDEKMAKSVDLLKQNGFWEDLVQSGGSREYILSLPVSDPTLKRLDTADKRDLEAELKKYGKKSETGFRSNLTSISMDTKMIRSMSTFNSKGEEITVDSKYVSDYVFGWHMVDFWTNVCLCHSLIIEERKKDGKVERVYQGPSPDEVALVEAGKALGFEFKERTKDGISLEMHGHAVKFEILNVLEFSSDRKRMSVVAKSTDGIIRLFCKGADNVMLNLLKEDIDKELKRKTEEALHNFSVQGLRTLVLGTRLLTEKEYNDWDSRYQEAARSLADDREKRVDELSTELERDLELVGMTAIEDKLQEGVPDAIATLRLAGMKVWMITGDKMETAINIGISCNLITSQNGVLTLSADNKSEAEATIRDIRARADELKAAGRLVELVVDGPSLIHILGNELETQLADLGAMCSGVVICRSSPSQKAAIVKIMTNYELRLVLEKPFLCFKHAPWMVRWWRAENRRIQSKALGIGDGANDVAMIQASDVGIGIAGKEGRQAVNNSDYAIHQFRHLTRLLLVHGQLSHYRLARLIKFSFFKNMAFASILILYQFYCGYSGQTLIDDISAAMFNVVFTSMPILLFSLLDRPMDPNTMMRFPQIYNHSDSLSGGVFWKTGVLQGFIDGAICFFVPFYSITPSGPDAIDGLWAVGKAIFVAILGAVTLEACLVARYWTSTFALFAFLSYFLVFPFFLLFPIIQKAFDVFDSKQYGIAEDLFGTAIFWLVIFAVYSLTFGHRYFMRTVKWLFHPDDNMILAEFEQKGRECNGLHDLSVEEENRLEALGVTDVKLAGASRGPDDRQNP